MGSRRKQRQQSEDRQPRSPAWRQWRAQVDKTRDTVRKHANARSMHGELWTAKMVSHYARKWVELLEQEPDG